MKLDDGTGEVLWSQHYASAGDENESVYDMRLDASGDVIVTGRMNVPGRLDDLCTIKFANADGALVWESLEGGDALMDDRSLAVDLCSDGCPVVTGLMQNTDGTATMLLVKYDAASGGALWAVEEAGINNDQTGDGWVLVDGNDDVIAAWKTWGGSTSFDIVVAKYDGADGTELWQTTYNHAGASADDPSDMVLDGAGNPIVVGSTAGDYLMVKFDGATGSALWSDTYVGPQGWYDVANRALMTPDGDLVVTGFSDGTGTSWDVATLGYDPATGTRLWEERWDGLDSSTDEGRGLAVDAQARLYVSGYTYSNTTGMDQLVVAYQLPTGTAVETVPGAAVAMSAFPNPFNPRVGIAVDATTAGHAVVEILDARGRRLAVVHDGPLAVGRTLVTWDGVADDGRAMPSGAYFARLRGAAGRGVAKLVLAR